MKYRILVVDDDEDILDMIRVILKDEYEVLGVKNGESALEVLGDCEPDLFILDVIMPDISGFEVCERIRNNEKFKNTPIFFLTVKGSLDFIKAGYKKGANLYLTKPMDPHRIKKNIDVYFEKNQPPSRVKKYSFDELKGLISTKSKKEPVKKVEPQRPVVKLEKIEKKKDVEPVKSKSTVEEKRVIEKEEEVEREEERLRVILVDDDEDLLKIMETAMLEKYDLLTETDGIEGLNKIIKYEPDLIILDIMLPKMSGLQICESIKNEIYLKDIPLIFVSAKSDKKVIEKARMLGALDFIPKPFDPLELLRKIGRMKIMARSKEMTFGEILKKEALLENKRAAKNKKREVTYQRKKEASHIDFID